MATKEQLLAAGFSEDEIYQNAGFSPEEIRAVMAQKEDPYLSATRRNIFEENARRDIDALERAKMPISQENVTSLAKQAGRKDLTQATIDVGIPLATAAAGIPLANYASKAPFLGRVGAYMGDAAIDAGGQYVGDKLKQDLGLTAPTTGEQDFNKAATTFATDLAIPGMLDIGASAIPAASSVVNNPRALSRGWGATANDNNRAITRHTPEQAVAELMDNEEFRKNVVGNVSVNNAFDNLQQMKLATGADIRQRYKDADGLAAESNTLLTDPRILDIQQTLEKYNVPESVKKRIRTVYDDISPILSSRPTHSIADLWELRRYIDSGIDWAKTTKNLDFDQQTAETLRTVLSEHITDAISKNGGADLLELNKRYNNISTLEVPMGKRSGQMSDDNIIGYDSSAFFNPKMGNILRSGMAATAAGTLGAGSLATGAAALAAPVVLGNPGRATLFKAGELANKIQPGAVNLAAGIGAVQGAIPDPFSDIFSPPQPRPIEIPRNWQDIKTDSMHLTNAEGLAIAMGIMQPGQTLTSLPEQQAKQIVGAVAGMMPQAFTQTPDKINVIDDQYQDPFGKQVVISGAMQSSPEERAMRIGSTYTNKYVPPQVQTPIKQPPPALPATLDRLNKNLDSAFAEAPIQTPTSYDGSLQSQLEQLTRMEALNSSDIQ